MCVRERARSCLSDHQCSCRMSACLYSSSLSWAYISVIVSLCHLSRSVSNPPTNLSVCLPAFRSVSHLPALYTFPSPSLCLRLFLSQSPALSSCRSVSVFVSLSPVRPREAPLSVCLSLSVYVCFCQLVSLSPPSSLTPFLPIMTACVSRCVTVVYVCLSQCSSSVCLSLSFSPPPLPPPPPPTSL